MIEQHATFGVVWPSVRSVAEAIVSEFYFEPAMHLQYLIPIFLSFADLICHVELDNQLWPKLQ